MIMKCGSKKSGSTLGRLEFGALGEDKMSERACVLSVVEISRRRYSCGQTYVNVNERRSCSASDGT